MQDILKCFEQALKQIQQCQTFLNMNQVGAAVPSAGQVESNPHVPSHTNAKLIKMMQNALAIICCILLLQLGHQLRNRFFGLGASKKHRTI